MKDIMMHKGFIGTVHYNADDEIFHGKIEGINDLITFEGNSVKELKEAFVEAVEDYVILCKETGKEPLKSCKGSFNIRIPPELHINALIKATTEGISLNHFIKKAIEREMADRGQHKHPAH
ncbi:MAG: type II toxin-antitoxin system HicB family antitoxin [Proteobacteria bacterium]|nr:type II toxin-antitoxin system HicB family antitoxin [Pseudomonadota bacterium]